MNLSRIYSNNKERTFATGVVNPKTTALFFDKLWVPDNEANLFSIPKSIRLPKLNIGNDDEYVNGDKLNESRLFKRAILSNTGPSLLFDPDEMYRYKSQCNQKNSNFDLWEKISSEASAAYAARVEQYVDKDDFLTSFNRNEALRIISNYYQRHGIPLVPIFLNKTDFEKSLLMTGPQNRTGLPDEYFNKVYSEIVRKRNVNVIEATIKSIPVIVEENLTWNQVKEIRKDSASIEKLRKFRLWTTTDLRDKSETEIADIIANSLEEYEYVLRKYGIMTVVGSMTTVLSSISAIVGSIENSQAGLIATGLSVSAGLVAYSAQQFYAYLDTKRQPIAYIYNIMKQAL